MYYRLQDHPVYSSKITLSQTDREKRKGLLVAWIRGQYLCRGHFNFVLVSDQNSKEKKSPSGHCYDCLYLYFKVDEGGVKNLMADSWTTFLKARVMCGAGNTQQQYNNLKQAVVLTAQDKRAGVLYGLFSNAW